MILLFLLHVLFLLLLLCCSILNTNPYQYVKSTADFGDHFNPFVSDLFVLCFSLLQVDRSQETKATNKHEKNAVLYFYPAVKC